MKMTSFFLNQTIFACQLIFGFQSGLLSAQSTMPISISAQRTCSASTTSLEDYEFMANIIDGNLTSFVIIDKYKGIPLVTGANCIEGIASLVENRTWIRFSTYCVSNLNTIVKVNISDLLKDGTIPLDGINKEPFNNVDYPFTPDVTVELYTHGVMGIPMYNFYFDVSNIEILNEGENSLTCPTE